MNEIANELAAFTLRLIHENGGNINRNTLDMIKKTGEFACATDEKCDKVKELVAILRERTVTEIKNENGPGLSGWTGEVLAILRQYYFLYLR